MDQYAGNPGHSTYCYAELAASFINFLYYWMDNIKTWARISEEESIRMTEDRDKWRKYVHGVANPRIEDG